MDFSIKQPKERSEKLDQTIKIMPCLDMQNGRVVKGIHFVDIRDAGDPVECARAYCETGADELALLDITATVEGRATMLDVVKRVAEVTTVPFTVGGGISDVKSAELVLSAGANKVSTSSAAFRKPELVEEMVKALGAEKVNLRWRCTTSHASATSGPVRSGIASTLERNASWNSGQSFSSASGLKIRARSFREAHEARSNRRRVRPGPGTSRNRDAFRWPPEKASPQKPVRSTSASLAMRS